MFLFNYDSLSSDNYINMQLKNINQQKIKNNNHYPNNDNIKMKKIMQKINKDNQRNKVSQLKQNNLRKIQQKPISPNRYINYMNDTIKMSNQAYNHFNNNIPINSKNNISNAVRNNDINKIKIINIKNNRLENKRYNSQLNFYDRNKINNMFDNHLDNITSRNNNIIRNEHKYYSPKQNLNRYKNNSVINRINYYINDYNSINFNNTEGDNDYYINYL